MNNIAPKLQKCWTHKIAFKIISKMLKQPNFFHSQPPTFSKEALEKVLPFSTTFDLSRHDKFFSPYPIADFLRTFLNYQNREP